MRVTVFGAAGKTGELVVKQAVAAGHKVTAFVRQRNEAAAPAGVEVAEGDATDLTAVSRAVAGADAVLDCIGGTTPYKHTDLERNTAETILQAIREQGTSSRKGAKTRLIAISMMGVGDSTEQTPFWYEYLLMPVFLRGSTPDKAAMEAEVRASGVDYVLVRPPLLTDDAPMGKVKVFGPGEKAHRITRTDLANFMVDQIGVDTYLNRAVVVGNS